MWGGKGGSNTGMSSFIPALFTLSQRTAQWDVLLKASTVSYTIQSFVM